jgi:tetratricopeptide (TPR) repeat protein
MKAKPARKDLMRSRRPGRRSPPPPAILHGPDETLDGVHILDEMRNGVGVLLWQSLHDVLLWASVPPAQRAGLFRPESVRRRLAALVALGPDPALDAALTALATLSREPDTARPEAVSAVCMQVARWAEGKGSPATALAFAQGAAVASPAEAAPGLMAGCLARSLGERARAETWLRRTIVLGRRSGDRTTLLQACLVLAEMHAERGDRDGARALLLRAFRGARRSGFREIKGQALHGLFRLAAASGCLDDADAYGRSALHAYGRRNPRVPQVAREVGSFWLEREKYPEALAALRLLLPFARQPGERVEALAAVARAAAGAGSAETFEAASREAMQLLRRTPPGEVGPRPLLDLARGATTLQRWESAERAARLALDAAARAGEPPATLLAEEVLSRARGHGTAAGRLEPTAA